MATGHGSDTPDEIDVWLKAATAGADLKGVKLTYTNPVQVEPWVKEFGRVVSRGLFRYARRYRDD